MWFVIRTWFDFEWPMFNIFLDNWIIEFSSNESLCVKDSVEWVFSCLVVSSITNESFSISESNVWWSCSVTLIVSDDLDSFVFPESNTRVSGTEINTNGFTDGFFIRHLSLFLRLIFKRARFCCNLYNLYLFENILKVLLQRYFFN